MLAASPDTASSLVYALSAIGALEDPTHWVLSPTLHTPAFLDSIPKGALTGPAASPPARWPAPATSARHSATAGRTPRSTTRIPSTTPAPSPCWPSSAPCARSRPSPPEHGPVQSTSWRSPRRRRLRSSGTSSAGASSCCARAQEIAYFGLTGQLAFDNAGQTQTASTKWWGITDEGFMDLPHMNTCQVDPARPAAPSPSPSPSASASPSASPSPRRQPWSAEVGRPTARSPSPVCGRGVG